MDPAEGLRGRDSCQRRSPLDLLMSQIRRKRNAADRKPALHFLSRPQEREPDERDSSASPPAGGASQAGSEADLGWGRLCVLLQRLGKKADSRTLNLAHCDLTATDLLELATLFRSLPQLEELDLSWNELIGGSLRALTSHLQHVGGLTTLRLCGCRLTADDARELSESLGCLPLLEKLDLSWNTDVGGGALQRLLGALPPTTRELHLVACQLTAAEAADLGAVVSGLPGLCVLDVSYNPLLAARPEDGGPGGLGELVSPASFTCLGLQACGLTPSSLQALGGSLRSLPSLRELDLSSNRGLSGGLSHLTPHLSHLTHLESLDLHLCCLTCADLASLIQALPSLRELSELDLSSNKEVGGVVHPLVSALPLPQMRRLPLNSCRLDEDSFSALALAVPYLRSVDVSWCKVAGGRLALLLDALQPSVIQELRLNSCQLTTEDLCHLGVVCRRGSLSSLRVLELACNGHVTADGWAAMFTAAGEGGGLLRSLQELDVSLRPLTPPAPDEEAWLPALLSALPSLPALRQLALRRRRLGPRARQRLGHALARQGCRLDWDTPAGAVTSPGEVVGTHREQPELAGPEE